MKSSIEKPRYLYIDNLRLLMIIFVVMIHFAVTYSGIGSWYFMDTHKLDTVSYVFFGLFQSFTQAYFMGFLFLISGYFVAKSYDKKGSRKYITDRLIRLGIPVLVYMLLINPFCMYVLLGNTWDRPIFIQYYFNYLMSFDFIGSSGPLWFAFALLIFNCIYVLIRINIKNKPIEKEKKVPRTGAMLLLIFIIAFVAYVIRLVQPIGTDVANMQLCFFSQYIILFIIGVKAGRYDWFSQISYKTSRRWLFIAFVPGILLWFLLMLIGGALTGSFDPYNGGGTWQSALYAIWESLIVVAMSVALVGIFREKHNKQSKFIKTLSDNSFGVYVFHAPIIIIVSMVMVNIPIYPILKYLIACVIGIPLSFVLTHYVIRRIPLLKKVL